MKAPKRIGKKKIFNDPVYGFVSVPYGIIFDLIEHPFFQRLRRIKQLSLTHYVYPGALHTRFHHALGAFHLMDQAIEVLRSKGVEISEEEATAVSIAILLHDIGHGPFSHTLERSLINVNHESISEIFMMRLNEDFGGALDLAITIFQDKYERKFFHQLVSGQLDMDRMDYLNRDSFFTGVYEGVIGYDRIIKMLHVHQDELVVEEKGIYSIEKFLMARRLMYWQVYLHKAVLSAEQMLFQALKRAKVLVKSGEVLRTTESLYYFLESEIEIEDFMQNRDLMLSHFARLDDFDIITGLKNWMNGPDPVLAFLSEGLVNRKLFRLLLKNEPFKAKKIKEIKVYLKDYNPFISENVNHLFFSGKETNNAYSTTGDEIKILFKSGQVKPMSKSSDLKMQSDVITKHFLCFPKV